MPESDNRWTRSHTLAVTGAVAMGWLLRTIQYAANPSLWNDEQLLALNIGRRTEIELLLPLDHNQSAPVGFLVLERLITRVTGMGDLSLRFLPFVAGMLVIVVGVLIARRLVKPAYVVLAALLLAFSPMTLLYARELKPYSMDALVAAQLLWLALRALEAPTSLRVVMLGAAGVASVWFSHPALFVLAGVAAACVAAWTRRDVVWRRRCMLLVSAWLVAGGLNYLLFVRQATNDPYLRHFMAAAMPSIDGRGVIQAWHLLRGELLAFAVLPARHYFSSWLDAYAAALAACSLAGAGVLLRRRGLPVALLFAAPFAIALVAAFLHVYPIIARLVQWLAAPLIVLVVVCLEALLEALRAKLRRPVLAVVALGVVATAGRTAAARAIEARSIEDPRSVVRDWRAARSTNPVYVSARGAPAWAFYSTDWTRPDTARLDWYAREDRPGGRAIRNAPSRRHAVVNEGFDMVLSGDGHAELLGTPSGMQVTLAGMSQEAPDTGWAENEARRIKSAAQPDIWLFFSHQLKDEHLLVLSAVEALGGRTVFRRIEPGAALFRVHFDATPHRVINSP